MKITVLGTVQFVFFFFCAFHIAIQVLWVLSEWWLRWDNLVEKAEADRNFCDDVCNIARASRRYGDNVKQCSEICRPSYQMPIVAASSTLANYHPCGLNTPCMQALFDFLSSVTGAAWMVLAILVLPGIIRQLMCPVPSMIASSTAGAYRRPRQPLTIQVDEMLEEDEPPPRLLPPPPARGNFVSRTIGWFSGPSQKVHHI